MKLTQVRVTNYKSIDDSGWVNVDNVTCLVGKNEAGKTAFLKALQKINPINGVSGDFDGVTDYPRKGYHKYKMVHATTPAEVVSAMFELSDSEADEIEAAFGKGVLGSRIVEAHKNYANSRYWILSADEAVAVNHIIDGAGFISQVEDEARQETTIAGLISFLTKLTDRPPSVETLLTSLTTRFETSLTHQIINKYLTRMCPRFFYFDEYSVMRGRSSVQDLKARTASGKLGDADRTFMALLSIVNAELDDLDNQLNYEKLKAELEAASNGITDEVFQFWSQNKQLEVEFDLSPASTTDPAPLNQGTILHIRIKNQRHRVTVPFDERSRGFVWFFSFLAYFSQLVGNGEDLVLLLDEPGLNLHAKAQGDFLRLIEERLAPRYQTIYTTHSPFMIDPSHLERVRTVQDTDNLGTVISNDVLRNDRDTLFPIQAALGYDLAQTLFIGPNCLLVEGSSDLIYLQILSGVLESQGKIGLDPHWVIVPVGGADKVSTFVSLLGGNQLNIAVLMDVAAKDMQRIQTLQANALFKPVQSDTNRRISRGE